MGEVNLRKNNFLDYFFSHNEYFSLLLDCIEEKMVNVIDLRTHEVRIPIPEPHFHPSWIPGFTEKCVSFTLVEVISDEGVKGYSAVLSFNILGTKRFIDKSVKSLLPLRIEDASDIREFVGKSRRELIPNKDICKLPYRKYRCIPHVTKVFFLLKIFELRLWCVEIALWDLLGRAKNKSVCELLGKRQNKVRVYVSTGETVSVAKHVEFAIKCKESGIRAIKLRVHRINMKEDLKGIEKIREAIGYDMEVKEWTLSNRPPLYLHSGRGRKLLNLL